MRASIKDSIALFNPQGFLDGNNASSLLSVSDMEATLRLKVDMVLVSLKKVIFFNKNGLEMFIRLFEKVRKEHRIMVGFCDYDDKKFNAIKRFFEKEMNFFLFDTYEVAKLFTNGFNEKEKTILLYSQDKSQRAAIAIELHNRGHNPIIAQTKADFEKKKESKDSFDIIIEKTYLGDMGEQVAARVTANAVIYTLSGFLDNEITSKFNITYHNNSLNIGFRLFIFDAFKVSSMNIHGLNFFAKLASSSAEYNATLCFVGFDFSNTPSTFKDDLEDAGILFYDKIEEILGDKELLAELGGSSAAAIQQKKAITKQIVSQLPTFVNAIVETLEMMTNAEAVKEEVKIKELTLMGQKNLLASSIGFYGDMDGMIVLIFPKNIAQESCSLLIGEKTDDLELILDSLGELVNIVGGKLKTLLSDAKIYIQITLPRTYDKIEDLLEVIGQRKGVQVDLKFGSEHFTFFLTR